MTNPDILPDSRLTTVQTNRKVQQSKHLGWWQPIYCASCGADGGFVPEENQTYAFYLCQPCAEKYGQIAGMMIIPDEVFYAKVAEVQLEKYGRYLSSGELLVELDNPDSSISRLARERSAITRSR